MIEMAGLNTIKITRRNEQDAQGVSMLMGRKLYLAGLCIISIFFAGCQPKVYLMPSPAGIVPGGELFNLSQNDKDDNLLYTLFATNRQPIDSSTKSDYYSIFPSDTLRMGFVVHRVGAEGMSWEEIYNESLQSERSRDILITREYAREIVEYDIKDDLSTLSSQAYGFFEQINELLDKNIDKDILIYVHGANSSYYRATAQGAQFYHFTGHNSVVISFSWPSAENILKYKVDVMHAKKTVPAFARLIELLATHTEAKHINILAYSAGAQVTAPGLVYLREAHPDMTTAELKKKFRIREVYFASPDAEFKSFAQRYVKFKDIVGRTTINMNLNDRVLEFSAFQNGFSRLGRPDLSEVSPEDLQILIDASNTPQLDLLDVAGSTSLDIGHAHDSWYNHPWVSTDVLMLLLFNADPLARGLEQHRYEDGSTGYLFPEGYDRKIRELIAGNKKGLLEKLKAEGRD